MESLIQLLLIGSAILSLASGADYGRKCESPDERLKEVDDCISTVIMFGDDNFKAPLNEAELDTFCNKTGNALACAKSYVRECLEPFPKQLLTFGVQGASMVRRKNCIGAENRREFLKHMPCMDKHINEGHKLMKVSIMATEFIRDQMPFKQKLPGVCCTHFHFRKRLLERLTSECSKSFNTDAKESGEFLDNMIGEATASLMDFMCGKYTNLETCDANLEALMSRIRELNEKVDKDEEITPQSHAILFPMLDVFTSAAPPKS